jgi:hypothetical protein
MIIMIFKSGGQNVQQVRKGLRNKASLSKKHIACPSISPWSDCETILVSLNGGVISKVFIARFLARSALIGSRRAAWQSLSAELPLHLWPTRIPGRQLGLGHPGRQLQQAVTRSLE